jgi:cytoskeleton protein RodZ
VGIGEQLRARRLERGLSLQEAEAATKIRVRYLEAIEAERWDLLPGTAYAQGFIRAYANLLGLDGGALVAEWRRTQRPEAGEEAPVAPRARPAAAPAPGPRAAGRRRRGRGGTATVAVAVLLVLAAALAAHHGAGTGRARPAAVPGAPPAAATATASAGATATTTATVTATASAGPQLAVRSGSITLTDPPYSYPLTTYALTGADGVDLSVAATDRCWLRVWVDDAPYTETTLSAGQTASWHAARRLQLLVGNPAGLVLRVDGLPVPGSGDQTPRVLVFALGGTTP